MKISCLALILLFAVIGESAIASTCFDPSIPRGKSSSRVKLNTDITKPYFYFRAFDYNFAVLVSQNDIRKALESESSIGGKDASGLLKLLAQDLPLAQSTDLFKYVLLDSYQLSVIQRVLVGLLGRGDAAVFDAETGRLSATIEMKLENSEHIRSRVFYDSNREMLIQSVDCVEN